MMANYSSHRKSRGRGATKKTHQFLRSKHEVPQAQLDYIVCPIGVIESLD